MGDQGRWFKLWCSCVADPSLDNLPLADFGRWAKLGAIIKEQGTDGVLILSEPARTVCAALQLDGFQSLISCIQTFPNVRVSSVTNTIVSFRIEYCNWRKYQGDFSTDRVQRHRAKKRESETPKKRGDEKRGDERKRRSPPPTPQDMTVTDWPSPIALVRLYNESTPDNVPSVETLRGGRLEKAKRYLKIFPEKTWWEEVFAMYRQSSWLRGLVPPKNGHEGFVPDFDWLLSKGKDGSDNCVKVHDGRYCDGPRHDEQ